MNNTDRYGEILVYGDTVYNAIQDSPERTGTVVEIEDGCNGVVYVRWGEDNYLTPMVHTDIAKAARLTS